MHGPKPNRRLGATSAAGAVATLTAVVLAGCGASSGPKSRVTPSPPRSPSATATPTPTPTSTPSPASVIRCTFQELSVSDHANNAATGHWGFTVVFRNVGSTRCVLGGYPGVAGLSASGRQIVQATRTLRGFMGGLPSGQTTIPVVRLQPGQTASTLVEGSDVPQGNSTHCPALAGGLLVTPPGSRHSAHLKEGINVDCGGLQVHPVVAGSSGGVR